MKIVLVFGLKFNYGPSAILRRMQFGTLCRMNLLLLWLHAMPFLMSNTLSWVWDKSVKWGGGRHYFLFNVSHILIKYLVFYEFVRKKRSLKKECGCVKCGEKKPSWNLSFTLTWLRKMCVDKLENVLVTFGPYEMWTSATTEGDADDYDSQLDFYLITYKVDVVVKNWNLPIFILGWNQFSNKSGKMTKTKTSSNENSRTVSILCDN